MRYLPFLLLLLLVAVVCGQRQVRRRRPAFRRPSSFRPPPRRQTPGNRPLQRHPEQRPRLPRRPRFPPRRPRPSSFRVQTLPEPVPLFSQQNSLTPNVIITAPTPTSTAAPSRVRLEQRPLQQIKQQQAEKIKHQHPSTLITKPPKRQVAKVVVSRGQKINEKQPTQNIKKDKPKTGKKTTTKQRNQSFNSQTSVGNVRSNSGTRRIDSNGSQPPTVEFGFTPIVNPLLQTSASNTVVTRTLTPNIITRASPLFTPSQVHTVRPSSLLNSRIWPVRSQRLQSTGRRRFSQSSNNSVVQDASDANRTRTTTLFSQPDRSGPRPFTFNTYFSDQTSSVTNNTTPVPPVTTGLPPPTIDFSVIDSITIVPPTPAAGGPQQSVFSLRTKRKGLVGTDFCSGSNDLGFCERQDKYPGPLVEEMMSECEELVDRMHVTVPNDLKLLDASSPVAELTSLLHDAMQGRGASTDDGWSWSSYRSHKGPLCDSERRVIEPNFARDINGRWKVVVQTEQRPQRVVIDICLRAGDQCRSIGNCGINSRCLQTFNYHVLMTLEPDMEENCPKMALFKFPNGCVCHIDSGS